MRQRPLIIPSFYSELSLPCSAHTNISPVFRNKISEGRTKHSILQYLGETTVRQGPARSQCPESHLEKGHGHKYASTSIIQLRWQLRGGNGGYGNEIGAPSEQHLPYECRARQRIPISSAVRCSYSTRETTLVNGRCRNDARCQVTLPHVSHISVLAISPPGSYRQGSSAITAMTIN